MNLQALLIRATASIASGLILAAAVLVAGPAHTKAAPAYGAPIASTSTQPQPVVLPTIHVHPTPQQRMAATTRREAPTAEAVVEATPRPDAAAAIPSLRGLEVDMPYYSFGKVLPRIGAKE